MIFCNAPPVFLYLYRWKSVKIKHPIAERKNGINVYNIIKNDHGLNLKMKKHVRKIDTTKPTKGQYNIYIAFFWETQESSLNPIALHIFRPLLFEHLYKLFTIISFYNITILQLNNHWYTINLQMIK